MLFDYFSELNWLAVIVAGLAYFALGAVYYSDAVLGKQYRAATGVEMDAGGRPQTSSLVLNLVGWLIAATALGLVAYGIGADGFGDGLVLGLVAGIGFVVTSIVVTGKYAGTNMMSMQISAGYTILGYLIMGVILAAWT